ncbi:hypothetical protein AB0F49_28105 [Micromonospora ureilytica]|uniref:hypothetical protein n=1 Tax=Micromonospora ureilytica TaxID=709868 RepID=UPI00340AA185
MKDLTAFYAVVSGVCFTLLGLWWVAVQEIADLRRSELGASQMAYLVSLQFALPGTAALLSQVAPAVPMLWRSAFVIGGVAGAVGILFMAPLLRGSGRHRALSLLRWIGVPLYLLIVVVAAAPGIGAAPGGTGLTRAQIEGVLFCVLVLLGVQTAWTAAMSPEPARTSFPG